MAALGTIAQALDEIQALRQWVVTSSEFLEFVKRASEMIVEALKEGNQVLICGNGGSAADAQHFAGELVGKYNFSRPGLKAQALTTDTSILTAVANDYGFDWVFSRQVECFGSQGDVLVAISTSGTSLNVLAAVEAARRNGLRVIGLSGRNGAVLRDKCDLCLLVPSSNTPRIQEVHQIAYHLVCHLVEMEMFGNAEGSIS